MPDPLTPAEWASQEPQRSYIDIAERLEDKGFTASEQADALLTLALSMLTQIHGPQWVAARLVLLADKYHAEAEMIRRSGPEAADGSGN